MRIARTNAHQSVRGALDSNDATVTSRRDARAAFTIPSGELAVGTAGRRLAGMFSKSERLHGPGVGSFCVTGSWNTWSVTCCCRDELASCLCRGRDG